MEYTKEEIEALCRNVLKDEKIVSPLDIGAIQGEPIVGAGVVFRHPECEKIFAILDFLPKHENVYLIWFAQEEEERKIVLEIRRANAKEIECYRAAKTNA